MQSARHKSKLRVAVIGYGAITHELVDCLETIGERERVVGILDIPERVPELKTHAQGRFAVVSDLEELLGLEPDLVVECAGQSAVEVFGAKILERGIDLLIASVGALTNEKLTDRLAAAANGKARLLITSGAVAGIDGIVAARTAGLQELVYTSIKPPKAWKQTPAELLLDLDKVDERTIFFEGSARKAAHEYPQNANVGATIALSGLGLDHTHVRLGADPAVSDPLGIIDARGDFGWFHFDILARAAPNNPKTSLITAHSIGHAILYDRVWSVFDECVI